MNAPLDVAVVGAGPAGLATAYALAGQGRTVRVLEAAGAVGGRMRTVREHGCLIDTGAEMFPGRAGYPATWKLIADLGLDRDPAAVPSVRDALAVWRDGRARPNAGRPLGLLTGAGLSLRARADLMRLRGRLGGLDPDRPERAGIAEETVADLVRPYHPDVYDYLVHPLVGGFFGWDPARSAAAPFAAHLAASGGSHTWHTYRDGMDTLARALADRLDVTTDHPVTRVAVDGDAVRVESPRGTVTARAVVLAVPAPVAAGLYDEPRPAARLFLAECGYTPMLRVSLVLDALPEPARASFATLVPAAADPLLNVVTRDHRKHPGRAPRGRALISLIPSPRGCRELFDAPDRTVAERLIARAGRFVPGLDAAGPSQVRVHRFRHGLPEATPRALRLRGAFADRPVAAVEYAGDWVPLRPCSEGAVTSADLAAERVRAHLSGCARRAAVPAGEETR
ncbi:NAD(P)/FAD-dependent oxidoreductase [Actinomadura chokoriensis]|uniref:protoporphyrinogen/coproporphyrinogen oxidase n=1 Tax=Actinomadura chokoriensis TaxID=454156 RepID=UPI0031F765BA